MSDSAPRSRKTPAPGAVELSTRGHGVWRLSLWDGSVWFSPWFYRRLRWPAAVKRIRLDDLKPHLPADAWEALLLPIRHHLESPLPLDPAVPIPLTAGPPEWSPLPAPARAAP